MSILFEYLSVAQMQEQGGVLLEEHYQELTLFKNIVKLDVDWAKYIRLERMDMLMSLGAWEDGVLIGYSVFAIQTNAHYKGLVYASNDVLFLRKDKRKGSAGIKLIKESEKRLLARGVRKIVWHIKFGTVLGAILSKMGYVDEEYTAAKILGD